MARLGLQDGEMTSADPPPDRPTDRNNLPQAELATILPPALLLIVLLLLAAAEGGGYRGLAAASLAVLVTQSVPGAMLWRTIRPAAGWWVEDLVLGTALGAALAVPSQVAAVALSARWLAWFVPVGLAVALVAVPATRKRVLTARCSALPPLWGCGVTVAAVIPALSALRFVREEPVHWTGWTAPYVDLPYHLALSGELSQRWPLDYPQVAGQPLHYHWFAHAWIAQVADTSGAPLDLILLRFMPVVMSVLVPLATGIAAVRISRLPWSGPVAAAMAFSFVELDVWRLGHAALPINPFSPTEGFGVLLLITTVLLLAMRWRGQLRSGGLAVALPALFLTGGSKGSTLPVLLCGCLVAAAAAVRWRSNHWRRVVGDAALVALALAVIVKVLFAGSAGGLTWAPLDGLARTRGPEFAGPDLRITGLVLASVVALTMLSVFLGYVGALGALSDAVTRTDPVGWLLAGCAMSGAGAILVFDHPGSGQWYFLWTAEVPMSLLAAWGALLVITRAGRPLLLTAVGAACGVGAVLLTEWWFGPLAGSLSLYRDAWAAFGTFCGLVITGSLLVSGTTPGGRAAKTRTATAAALVAVTVAGVVPAVQGATSPLSDPAASASTPGAFSRGQVAAARWIRDHSKPADIVMTNRHCRGRERVGCDARRFFVAAYSERQMLVEGWAYTQRASNSGGDVKTAPFWDPRLLALNDGFIAHPGQGAARKLYDLGVRWVFVDNTAPHARSLEPYARRRFANATATVYELLANS